MSSTTTGPVLCGFPAKHDSIIFVTENTHDQNITAMYNIQHCLNEGSCVCLK